MLKLILSFLILNLTVNSQVSKFKWQDECEYEAIFDSTKISRQQIIDAHRLTLWEDFQIQRTSVYSIKDLKRLNIDSLENEYKEKKQKLSTLILPNEKEWELMRQERLKEMEQTYFTSKILYKAFLFDDYKELIEFKKEDKCLNYYSTNLNLGGKNLISAWKHLTKFQAKRNGSPKTIWRNFYQDSKSDNKYLLGKIQTLTFGWWNCANNYIERLDFIKANDEFHKLFTEVKEIECEDGCPEE